MTLIFVVASLTLAASFLCSLLEAALYSVTPTQLDVMRENGVSGARRVGRFRAHVDEPIAAILTINTIAHTVGAAMLGALVARELGDAMAGWFIAIFTLAVLVVTEIVPKSIGVKFGTSLVPVIAWPLQLMIWASWPIARACRWLMKVLTGKAEGHVPTEAEIIAMSRRAGRDGELTDLETQWVENVLLLDQVTAHDIMTPRTVVQTVGADETLDTLNQRAVLTAHTRLPVTETTGEIDSIVGMIHRRDAEKALAGGEGERTVREIQRELDVVPTGMKAPQLLEKFIHGRKHMVVVVDEYGGVEGIVTLEDVLEAMLGTEIVDEHDVHVDMQELARRRARKPT